MVFVAEPAAPVLTQGDAHHLFDVLRLRPGEPVVAGDGAGMWCPCRVAPGTEGRGWRQMDPATLLVADGPAVRQARVGPAVTVAFAPTKGDRPEWVVQKLTELGVDRIVPLRTARSVVRWEGERGERAVSKLARVALEAAAQCRRTWLPEVGGVTTLDGLASAGGPEPVLARAGGGPPTWGGRWWPWVPKEAGIRPRRPDSDPEWASGRRCSGPRRPPSPRAPCCAVSGRA